VTPKPWRGIVELHYALSVLYLLGNLVHGAATGSLNGFWTAMGVLFAVLTVAEIIAARSEARRDVPLHERAFPPLGYRYRRTKADLAAAGRYVGESWRNLGGW